MRRCRNSNCRGMFFFFLSLFFFFHRRIWRYTRDVSLRRVLKFFIRPAYLAIVNLFGRRLVTLCQMSNIMIAGSSSSCSSSIQHTLPRRRSKTCDEENSLSFRSQRKVDRSVMSDVRNERDVVMPRSHLTKLLTETVSHLRCCWRADH